jgi:hypothetical protein
MRATGLTKHVGAEALAARADLVVGQTNARVRVEKLLRHGPRASSGVVLFIVEQDVAVLGLEVVDEGVNVLILVVVFHTGSGLAVDGPLRNLLRLAHGGRSTSFFRHDGTPPHCSNQNHSLVKG